MSFYYGDIFFLGGGQINNKRDTILLNIKIIRVIIPLTTILHGYRDYSDSEEFTREQRLYRSNRKN